MDPRHQLRGRLLLPLEKCDLMAIARSFHWLVAQPPVGMNCAAGFDGVLYEGHQAFRRGVRDATHANPPDPRSVLLRGDYYQCLTFRMASTRALINAGGESLVYLDPARQPVAPGPKHGATQLVQPSPGGLIALQFEDALQTQGAGAILLRRHPVHSAKPIGQWLACVLEDRPCCH